MKPPSRLIKAIIILPGSVLILIPAVILLATRSFNFLWGSGYPKNLLLLVAGLAFVSAGVFFSRKTVLLFVTAGNGTPAPWAPPKNFVASGPYRYVRNPMIISVISILLGEAILSGSFPVLLWAITFWLMNTAYFIWFEEPRLEKKFGEEYLEYKRHVRRWIPRLSPWEKEKT